jgi:hypothetical protein
MRQERISGKPMRYPTGSDERERVVEVLTRHYANDELTETELETRLQRVYSATTSRDLDVLLADLPAPTIDGATADAARTSRSDISELLSGHEKKLVGVVPSELRLRVQLGYIELDLTGATFEPGITNIEVQAFMGYIQIRFPPGIQVESKGHVLFGFFSFKGKRGRRAEEAEDTRAVVRVTGRATFGFAEGR